MIPNCRTKPREGTLELNTRPPRGHVYLVTYKDRVLSYFNVLNCCFVDLFECTCYLESRSRLVKQCLFCFDFHVTLWLD